MTPPTDVDPHDQLAVGERVDLSNCDREPIQIPGSIQPHGALLALTIPQLDIAQASVSCGSLLGRDPGELIGRPVDAVLGEAARTAIAASLQAAAEHPGLQLATVQVGDRVLEPRVHVSDGLLLCELEPVAAAPGDQAWFARELTRTMSALQRAEGVVGLAGLAVAEVRRLTGYDRVMVYRFDPDGHGEVIAEAREASLDSYLGQHYPASDIPRQARELYLRQVLRLIVDVDYAPSPIVPVDNPLTERPLDLGLAALRSVSPVHLQYLRNMGVRATLTISLKHEGELWGMIACHHYSPHYLTPQIRSACTLIGEVTSWQFAREEQADARRALDRLAEQRRALLGTLRAAPDLATGIDEHRDRLRALCDADGVSVVIDGTRVTSGTVPPLAVERALVDALPSPGATLASDRLPGDFPDLADAGELCGALAVALPRGVGEHIVWYRAEWRHELVWGGDPNDSLEPDLSSRDTKTLSPRRSFEAWRQAVIGRSRPWAPEHVTTAGELARELVEQAVSAMRERLAHVALHDPLTGLANRTLLLESLGQTLTRRPRAGREHAGVLFLDLDNFKLVNDSLGHVGGDALLRQTAERLSALLRGGDLVARLGGDEFVILMQGVNDPEELQAAARRVHAAFEAPFNLQGAETRASVSIGITSAELGGGGTAEELIHEADIAMYEAKRSGRGRWLQFGPQLSASRRRRVEIERRLDAALRHEELHLEYQPLLDDRLTVVGFEALARWQSPQLGRVGPDEFIPIAEEAGLMDEIGNWVLDTALQTLARVRRRLPHELFMAVNISAAQIVDIGFPRRVAGLLERHGVAGRHVCVEITEGVLISNTASAVPILEQLRELGVKVALDDFGTGFSSLAYLRRLPADILKLDRAFVAELGETDNDADVIAAVIDLARRLNLRTVAEGVETERQLDILQRMRCELLQGYLFSRPLPGEQLDTLAERGPSRTLRSPLSTG